MRTRRSGNAKRVPREVTVTFMGGRLPVKFWVKVPNEAPYTDKAAAIEKAGRMKKAEGWMTESALEHYRQHPEDAVVEWGALPRSAQPLAVPQFAMTFEYAS